jgi:hypothetical protein
MKILAIVPAAGMLACLGCGSAHAQTAPAAATPAAVVDTPAPAAPGAVVHLPMNTMVVIEFTTPLTSRTSKNDDMFPIRLVRPIMVGGAVVVPEGATGQGQVIQAAKSGWGGKAGELVVTVRYLDFAGVRIPLRRFRMGEPATGEDRRDAAFATSMVVPLAGFFMNGGEKTILAGTRANAIVSANTDIPAGAPVPAAAPATTTSN